LNSLDIVEILEREGYIDVYKGCVELWGASEDGKGYVPKETHPSLVIMKQKYLELWDCVDIDNIPPIQDEDVVVIRDRATKNEVSLRGHKGVAEMRDLLTRLNEKLSRTVITICNKECAKVQMK